jgi:CRP-like cAMP-binding protein
LFLSAEERFFTFMKERASLLEQVSQKYIASYLGLTPETFSRLRAKHQL